MLLITHDLGVVAETCDKVAIMYAGEIVEYGTLEDIFDHTRTPLYRRACLAPCPRWIRMNGRLQPDPRADARCGQSARGLPVCTPAAPMPRKAVPSPARRFRCFREATCAVATGSRRLLRQSKRRSRRSLLQPLSRNISCTSRCWRSKISKKYFNVRRRHAPRRG